MNAMIEGTGRLTVENAVELIPAIETYGKMIAVSKLFGSLSEAQGQTIVLMALSDGMPISEMKRRFHVVSNNLSMRADYMLAEFRRLGGKYRWAKDGDDGNEAVIHAEFGGEARDVPYSIDDARKEGLVKKDSRWEKNPGSMLRARAQTKMVRMLAPEVLAGFITEDEAADIADRHDGGEAVTRATATKPVAQKQQPASPAVVSDAAQPTEGLATGQQISRLVELFGALQVPADKQLTAMQKRGARDMASLSESAAAEMIAALEAKLPATVESVSGESRLDPQATSGESPGPCSETQIEQIKTLMRQLSQMEGQADIGERVKAKLASHGMAKLADLNATEAEAMLQALTVKNMEAFFDADLKGHSKNV